MICPVCSADLCPSRYEGLPVFACPGCSGYLVASRRVTDIKRRRGTTKESLIERSSIEGETDSTNRLKCPRCRASMTQEFWDEHPSFRLDTCQSCDFVWFDPGELARIQLDYEMSPQGRDAARVQDRLQNMSPEEKEAFEDALAKLPEGDATVASVFGTSLINRFRFFLRELFRD